MEDHIVAWIEFGAILVATGAVVLFLFFCVMGVRWYYRRKEMNVILNELRRDPFMVTHVHETKINLDCKVGEFRRVAFT